MAFHRQMLPHTYSPNSCSCDIEKPDVEGFDEGSVRPGSKMRVRFRSNFSVFLIGFWFFEPYVRCVVKRMPGSICLGSTIHRFLSETRKKSYKCEKQILGAFAVSDGRIAEGHNAKI